jgi:hypothetical protein
METAKNTKGAFRIATLALCLGMGARDAQVDGRTTETRAGVAAIPL